MRELAGQNILDALEKRQRTQAETVWYPEKKWMYEYEYVGKRLLRWELQRQGSLK